MATEQTATDDAVASLRSQIDKANSETAAATAEAVKARKEAEAAVQARVQADETAIQNGIAAATATLDSLESRYAEALEKGEHGAAAKINREMADASTTLRDYQRRDGNLKAWKKRATEEMTRRAQQQDDDGGGQQQRTQYTAQTQAWLDKHGVDGQAPTSPKFLRAQAAHFEALDKGLKADTKEYFEFLDGQFGPVATSQAAVTQDPDAVVVDLDAKPQQQQEQQRTMPSAMPPSRSQPQVVAQRSNEIVNGKVTLSPSELDAARYSNPDLWNKDQEAAIREYAVNKATLIKEGRL